jgi:hypothetical protein
VRLARIVAALVLAIACGGPSPTARPAGTGGHFIIPTQLANGRVEVTIEPHYTLGTTTTFPIAVSATRGAITGPVAARILASGINEGGSPAEALVRTLEAAPVTAAGGQRRTTSVTWDGRDEKGRLVPADAYSLVLDFRVEDGGAVTNGRAGVTVQMNAP